MKLRLILASLSFVALFGCSKVDDTQLAINPGELKVHPPESGIYHGAYPDFPVGIAPGIGEKIQSTDRLLAKPLALAVYQNDFVDGLAFPKEAVTEILAHGKVPLIRMMPRSIRAQFYGEDPIYKLQSFLDGKFDEPLRQWARQAKAVNAPLMVEFGPEVNGMWYPWSGRWNGWNHQIYYGDPELDDGPERFRDTYRRIIDLFRSEGVENITWVFHVDTQPRPDEPWNAMKNYYPGDSYIDWIGVSVFGAQQVDDWYGQFREILGEKWEEVINLSPNRPLAILEWGVIERPGHPNAKAEWIENALKALLSGDFPRIRAVSYWHESSWQGGPAQNFRIDTSPQSLEAYNRMISDPRFLSQIGTNR